MAGLEGANNDSVFIGKVLHAQHVKNQSTLSPWLYLSAQEGRPFEFSHLRARTDFCEGSSQVKNEKEVPFLNVQIFHLRMVILWSL